MALAAIQELYQLSQEQAARLSQLEKENAAQQQALDDLRQEVAALRAQPPAGGVSAPPVAAGGFPGGWSVVSLALIGLGVALMVTRRGGER